jgi:glycosyltransferase involved in cell wall biosynthesis
MKILILTQDYPSPQNPYAMAYVHTRALCYKGMGHEVEVCAFSAKKEYVYDGISVATKYSNRKDHDATVLHAPNLKNHLPYLGLPKNRRIIVFFHGHEVLRGTLDYPKPYPWAQATWPQRFIEHAYNIAKIFIIKKWLKFLSNRNRLGLIFVSDWMREQFENNMKCSAVKFGRYEVIPNGVHPAFLEKSYEASSDILADAITIRPLDNSKYAIDLVVQLAEKNPDKTFHVYGQGKYFEINSPPSNLRWIPKYIQQTDIPGTLNRYRIAIMPTRYDAQGVSSCEFASYGIPLLSSDVAICREMLASFGNVTLEANDSFPNAELFSAMKRHCTKTASQRFDANALARREVDFFESI